jgi:NAD(P)H-dependent FMN reductase
MVTRQQVCIGVRNLMSKLRVGIILGSTRPGRRGEQVANWVLDTARTLRDDVAFEVVDLADFDLPLLDEPMPASSGIYEKAHTRAWSEKITSLDAFIFVTAEYNHVPSPALINAIDFLHREWNDKAAAIVSYGSSASGLRAVEVLRLMLSESHIAHVRQNVAFSLMADFEKFSVLTPDPQHEKHLDTLLDQLVAWGTALQGVREQKLAVAA